MKRGHVLAVRLAPMSCQLPECGATFTPNKGGQRTCSELHGKRLWNRENPGAWDDRRRDNYHRRRATKVAASTGRPVILAEIRERDENRCHLCDEIVPGAAWPDPLSASLDHVVPLSRGGVHDPDNVRLAHLRCNVEKGDQLLIG